MSQLYNDTTLQAVVLETTFAPRLNVERTGHLIGNC